MLLEDNTSLLPVGVLREMQTGFAATVRLPFHSRTPPPRQMLYSPYKVGLPVLQAIGRDRGRSPQEPAKKQLPEFEARQIGASRSTPRRIGK